ncbi:hypothetical protein C4577_01630 [Candidatus Parcubacteria bacterium]|nr:MAG: hypothetical protein C4577_01630 [Candidatus Parcubacteria bacterium]
MSIFAFDIELFKNFFSVIFVNVDNVFDNYTFLIFEDRNDSQKIREFVDRPITLVGYNNLYFDNVILNALYEGYSCEQLYELGQKIIAERESEAVFALRRKSTQYKSIDFKELVGLEVGLKQVTVVLEWPKVQDLPLPHDAIIKKEDIPLILSYNENDVLPLVEMWERLQPEIDLRKRVNQIYKVDVTTQSESKIPNVIFEKLYSSAEGISVKELKAKRTNRSRLLLEDCLGKHICFQTNELKLFLDEIKDIDLIGGFKRNLRFANLTFNLGVGGLHTQDNPGKFYSTEEKIIIDADVTSFYPAIILKNNIKPEHLSNRFLELFGNMTRERTEAKAQGDKIKADILKISINAVFGKLGNKDYWFYDPKAFYSVTISGQLYLLSLVELLTIHGFTVISANTDGVICFIDRSRLEEYYQVCKEWEKRCGFKLEYSSYDRYIRRDVNNYIAKGDKIKRKGIFELRSDTSLYRRLMKSYTPEIVPKALTNHFIKDIGVEQTLAEADNIFEFLMSQRVNKKFACILRSREGDEVLQHTNRYYACQEGGVLIKKDQDREISILAGTNVRVANEIDKLAPFNNYRVNLRYYQSEVEKILNAVEPKAVPLSLF